MPQKHRPTDIARQAADADLARQRFLSQNKLKSTWENIFTRYARDFTGIADEIDGVTGEVVVDNGHLRGMADVEEEEDSEEDSRRKEPWKRGKGREREKGKEREKEKILKSSLVERTACDMCRDRDELDDSVCRYCSPHKKSIDLSTDEISSAEVLLNKDSTINKAATTEMRPPRGPQTSVRNWSPHKIHTYLRHIGALPDHPNSYCELAFQFEKHELDGTAICGDDGEDITGGIQVEELHEKLGLESFSDRMMVWAGILRLKKMAAAGMVRDNGCDPVWKDGEGEEMERLAGCGGAVQVAVTMKSPAPVPVMPIVQDTDLWAPPPEPEDPFYSPIWRDEHPDGTPPVFPPRSVDPMLFPPATVKGKRKKDLESGETPSRKKVKTGTEVPTRVVIVGAARTVSSATVVVQVPGRVSDAETETIAKIASKANAKIETPAKTPAKIETLTKTPATETPVKIPPADADADAEETPANTGAVETSATEISVSETSATKNPTALEIPAPKSAIRETPTTKLSKKPTSLGTQVPNPTTSAVQETPVKKSVTEAFKTPIMKKALLSKSTTKNTASVTKGNPTPRSSVKKAAASAKGPTSTPKKARTPNQPPTPGWTTSVDRAKMRGRSFLGYTNDDNDDELGTSPVPVAQKATKLVPITKVKPGEGEDVVAEVGKEDRHMCGRGFCFVCLDLEGEEDDLI